MIGKTISHYQIIEKLGEGGMGVVYIAQDIKLDRRIALKFLPPAFSFDEEAKQRFIHEAQSASSLQQNNICNIHEIGETDDGQLFISMDLYEGETLKKKIENGPIPIGEVVEITIQISKGLDSAHKNGIVHRDIKPANIFITNDGTVKILDFGLSKSASRNTMTKLGSTMGTVAYMSPEQTRGEEVKYRTDIWSLGIILYEMITGKLPFKGEYEQAVIYSILNNEPESLKSRSDLRPELDQIVNRILQKDQRSRYPSAEELIRDLEDYQRKELGLTPDVSVFQSLMRTVLKPRFIFPAILSIILLIIITIWFFNRQAEINWANEEALPEIEQMVNEDNWIAAFNLVKRAEEFISDDPGFIEFESLITTRLTILTDPPGADVYIREYSDIDGSWEKLGTTPIDSIKMPNYSFYLMKIEKAGYENVIAVAATNLDTLFRKLHTAGTIPDGMVYVDGYDDELADNFRETKNGFYLDRYEVTNKQFKKFIDDGGYTKPEYWKHDFIKDSRTLTLEEAMAEFIDKTGRPGPANWEASDYPDGQDDYPVSGVSWYEAAAYAEYAGKSLPTGYHWDSGAGISIEHIFYSFGTKLKPLSNFNGTGPEPVGKFRGVNLFGACDMAGNVREWCWNETEESRIITGGAWNDAYYLYEIWSQLPPMNRSPENGFRCVKYINKEKIPESAFELIELGGGADYSRGEPVPESIFNIYKNQFLYDKIDLNSKIDETDDTPRDWSIEKISFTAAYGNERVIAYLYLPKNMNPPFQTIIFFPGSYAFNRGANVVAQRTTNWFIDFILKNGRAVIYPVYKGTFERYDGVINSGTSRTHQYTDWLIAWTKDFSRSIDYLETRDDIDINRIGFYGHSWGGRLGGIIPAVEKRLKANILIVGGFQGRAYPEAAEINYLPRIKIPTLMLNGKYDHLFPAETSVKPFFDLLGTPDEDKRLLFYETGHFVAKGEMIKETLNWLDKYLGSPNK